MRSLLFVPADSERKLTKSLDCGADALIIDLEDSVVAARKTLAREAAAAFLAQARSRPDRPQLLVRVNDLETGLTDADLDAVVAAGPDAVVLPKSEGRASVIHLDAKLTAREAQFGLADGHIKIFVIATETGQSLFTTGTYRDASARLIALSWGAEDLSADIGAVANRGSDGRYLDVFRLARALCLAGAAAARVAAIDGICADFRDEATLRRDAEEARRDGFVGKVAIHPAQIPTINAVFTPSADEIAKARAVIAAFAAAPDAGAIAIEGVMYDRPHLTRAQRLLAQIARSSSV